MTWLVLGGALNQTEKLAYNWLTNILDKKDVHRTYSPDFTLTNEAYEAKRLYGHTIWFFEKQFQKLKTVKNCKILVFNGVKPEPVTVIPIDNAKVNEFTNNVLIKIINSHQNNFRFSSKETLILTRTPLRLPLGGGGSDIPEYYTKNNGGFWISGAIDKYIHVILKPRFESECKIVYSQTEIAKVPAQFQHPIIRDVLTNYNLTQHLELISTSDLPSGTGLGSSGSFTVGLLNAVHNHFSIIKDKLSLAEEAYIIEREHLNRKIGKQDQYAAVFGGVREYHVNGQGLVTSSPVKSEVIQNLEKWLLLFYVNQRSIPTSQACSEMSFEDRKETFLIGVKSQLALHNNDLHYYGQLVDEHWRIKAKYQPIQFNQFINVGKKQGALAAKLIGAGNGGCLLFVCPPENQLGVIDVLKREGLVHVPFKFEMHGSEVM